MLLGDEDIRPWILDKLARHGCWNEKHTSFDNIPKGAPGHLKGKIRAIAEQLITEGFLLRKPTSYGLEISLNFSKKEEIFLIIDSWKLKK